MSDTGIKHDAGKPRVDLLDPEFLLEMGRVMEFGAWKYDERNWEKGISYGRLFGSLLRHALGFWKGEAIDEESGLKALAHVAINAMMLASTPVKWDDRLEMVPDKDLSGTSYPNPDVISIPDPVCRY
jgi:hypothetical protein